MLPRSPKDLADWIVAYASGANANLAVLGYTAADIAAFTALANDIKAKIATEEVKKNEALAATEARNLSARNAALTMTAKAKIVLANPAIPADIKEQLGLKLPKPPTNTPPITPTGVDVAATPNGANTVTWESNGNIRGTQYIVSQKTAQNGQWRIVGAATARKFVHSGQVPGRHVLYRVTALRGGVESLPSVEAVAYGNAAFPLEDNGIV